MYDDAYITGASTEDGQPPSSASLGAWLRARRKVHDLTQEELADRVGCSRDMVRKIELGQRRPSKQVAELLAGSLGVPPPEWPSFVRWARTEGAGRPGTLPPLPHPHAEM